MKQLCAGLTLSATTLSMANDKPLDFWDEETRIFGTATLEQHVDASVAERGRSAGFELDHADHVEGDLSVLYTPSEADMPSRFGFVAGLWGESWSLSTAMSLRMWIKVQDETAPDLWLIRLVDRAGHEATGELTGTDTAGEWKELTLPLQALQTSAEFDWQQVALCEFDVDFSEAARIHLDGIRFTGEGTLIGVTDKPLTQRMAEADANRSARVTDAFERIARRNNHPIVSAFAKMLLDEDLDTANQVLIQELAESSDGNAWSLLHTPLYCRFYYMFSSRKGKFPGRLYPETEAQLLKTLWERTAAKNDIHWARQSTWWLDGSENHDLNAKASNLVTSRIFMDEPQYKDRIYPDYGFGGGYHYGHAGYYGPGVDIASRHGGGRANLADGKQYNAKDHYEAWLAFMKTYFRERAQRGFFLEYASHTYSKHTLNMVDLAYQYSGDEELHGLIDDFLTLYWAEWAQVSISGVRGGPKTRHHKTPIEGGGTSILISFLLGGQANADIWWYWNLINDYRLPPVVWRMALDRQGMGSYTYLARGIGEEENVWPRPLGTERTLTVDTESRFLKSTYVTPDYTLGTQMDHPAAIHSHLSITGRWHGMSFAQSETSRIVPVGLPSSSADPHNHLVRGDKNLELVLQTVHHQQTLIIAQARRWTAVHPEWYPNHPSYAIPMGIWVGSDWDEQIERDGWVFVQKGRAYAAVRPVLWDEEYERQRKKRTEGNQVLFNAPDDLPTVKLRQDCYSWNEDRSILILEDAHSPVIIEAGNTSDYSTLADFVTQVLDNPIALYKTVVPGYDILVYSGSQTPEIVFNAGVPQVPTIGGEPVNYSHPMTFDSPYLKSEYGSGKIHIEYGDEPLTLDFQQAPTGRGVTGEVTAEQLAFESASQADWREAFFDSGKGAWIDRWFLDGEVGSVETDERGMQLTAGPQFGNDAHHMVLWTRDRFDGDLKIEYEYTRLDAETRGVNILYIQATGSGDGPYVADITKWNDLRRVPAMSMYFDHMNTYHISYAAFPNDEDNTSYIRARRYMPGAQGLAGTDLAPDYFPEGLFETGVPHQITVIKRDRELHMRVANSEQVVYCHMTNPDSPPITTGRIGLRQMFTRSARYGNFRISVPE